MQQLDSSPVFTQQPYAPQIPAHVPEGSFAPGTPAHEFLMSHENAARTYEFQGNHFRGRLTVPGLTTLPEQDFSFDFSESQGYIKNHPEDHWPSIRIDFTLSSSNEAKVINFQVDSPDNTVTAGLLFTRLNFALYAAGNCYLEGKDGERILEFGIDRLSPLMEEGLLFRAKLFRKLKFIEIVFNTKFLLPPDYPYDDLERVELAFRGITEGEFTTRGTAISFYNYKPLDDELNSPPFTEPGPISHTFAQNLIIFDRVLPHNQVGPVSIHLDHTVVANSRVVDKLRAGEPVSQIRFIVFDHQIRYRFEKYAALSPQARRRRLEQFKKRLLKEEPEALVALLDEPLASDVSADEARQIVMGWLQFHDFPDRFCPQEPVLEEGRWRVPIWITYPNGQGGLVQHAFVDIKTGIVTVPISVEELLKLGKSIAMEILRAS